MYTILKSLPSCLESSHDAMAFNIDATARNDIIQYNNIIVIIILTQLLKMTQFIIKISSLKNIHI